MTTKVRINDKYLANRLERSSQGSKDQILLVSRQNGSAEIIARGDKAKDQLYSYPLEDGDQITLLQNDPNGKRSVLAKRVR